MNRGKLIGSIGLLSVILIVIIAVSLAWFQAEGARSVGTDGVVLTAASADSLSLSISDDPINANSYHGQTGTTLTGDDAPYVLEYDPVQLNLDASSSGYLSVSYQQITVTLPGVDENGEVREEVLSRNNKNNLLDENLYDSFTVRIVLKQVTDRAGNLVSNEEKTYMPQNGYMVETDYDKTQIDGRDVPLFSPLELQNGNVYSFSLQIVFQSEKNYRELLETQQDLDASRATPLSETRYIYGVISFLMTMESAAKHTITFDANGGSVFADGNWSSSVSRQVFGFEYLDMPEAKREGATEQEESYRFMGWYVEGTTDRAITPFEYLDNPIETDITYVAQWELNPKVTFYQSDKESVQSIKYVPYGRNVSLPSYTVDGFRIVGWSESAEATWNDTSTWFDLSTPIVSDIVLYPILRQEYTVTLDLRMSQTRYVTIAHHKNDQVTEVDGSTTETYTIKVLEGEQFGDYFNSNSGEYVSVEGCSSLYDFYGWVMDTYSVILTESAIANNVTIYPNDYVFGGDITVYAQLKAKV